MANVASIAFWRQNAATDLPSAYWIYAGVVDTPPRFTPTSFAIRRALWQGPAQDLAPRPKPPPALYLVEHNIFVVAYRDPACLWV